MPTPSPNASPAARPRAVAWIGDAAGFLRLIDQTLLPAQLAFRDCTTVEDVWQAIRTLQVRGAPAIGLAAAYGVVLGVRQASPPTLAAANTRLAEVTAYLRTSRPTAVNLFWALERMVRAAANATAATSAELLNHLLAEAHAIFAEDLAMCRAIGLAGVDLIQPGMGVLTHCNAGALATSDYGTALAPLFLAAERGVRFTVYVDETRPLLQGARLTAWELMQHGIDTVLLCDSMAGQVMKEGRAQLVIVGADRIAANGDTANKIGTYGLAVLAQAHGVPFYVAAPSSTFDLALADGNAIPIEERDPREVTHGFGRQTAPDGVRIYNPAFDVTPAHLLAGILTDRGLIRPVNAATIQQTLGGSR
jgi:methylthioribose-1-phosphate isomerase